MKITDKSRWRYDSKWSGIKAIRTVWKRDEWVRVTKQYLPDQGQKYLEIGCAPGLYTAAIAEGTSWSVTGIDYSEDSHLFKENMALVGKQANLIQADMFETRLNEKFGIVCSFGLVEHFRGQTLEQVFALHDSYVEQGGIVVISVPNFTGFQYVWHYIFDRPDLDNHNVDVMQPKGFEWFSHQGYEILHNDYVGVMRLWGNSGWLRWRPLGKAVAAAAVTLSHFVIILDGLGYKGFRGRTWSPHLLLVARKIGSRTSSLSTIATF